MNFSRNEKNILWLISACFIFVIYSSYRYNNTLLIGVASIFSFLVIMFLLVKNTRMTRNIIQETNRNNQSVTAIYSILSPTFPLPELGGYSLSATKAEKVMSIILEKKPSLIVELGSGTSTVIAGYCLKMIGHGKVISFDHDKKFSDITRSNIEKHNLSDIVKVVHAPLSSVEIKDKSYTWYKINLNEIENNIDLLFIDGPPRRTQVRARYPALSFFKNKLNTGAIIILDDANRRDEMKIKEMWLAENDDITQDESYFRDDLFISTRK